MKTLFLISIFLAFYTELNGLKSNKFCNLEKECVGKYDSTNNYKIVCEYDKCQHPYPYQCGSNKCAANSTDCDEYQEAGRLLNSKLFKSAIDYFTLMNQNAKKMHLRYIENFKLFQSKIKNCSKPVFDWTRDQMCLTGHNCFRKDEISNNFNFMFSNLKKYNLIRIDCPCNGNFNYHCGLDYCAINKRACDNYLSIETKSLDRGNFTKCNNDMIVFEKNHSLFQLII